MILRFYPYLREANIVTSEGGKTGITAVVTGLMFLVSLFFAPIFASIPSWATGGALVIVGSLMIRKCVAPWLPAENANTVYSLMYLFFYIL